MDTPPEEVTDIESLVGGRFHILSQLGEGGMGKVFVAQAVGEERVALKMMHRDLESSPRARQRFLRECALLERIESPHVVRLVDAGESAGGRVYLAMELLGGRSLGQRIDQEGALPVGDAIRIARRIADALVAAHAAGVVHRDLKPDNVFLLPDGGLRVLDFGIAGLLDGVDLPGGPAKLTSTGSVLGTPAYISPEGAAGHRVAEPADLYSLGVLLFEMLTGRLPFEGDVAVVLMTQHLKDPAPDVRALRPETPEPLARLVDQLLEKAPEARPASAAEVAATLGELEGALEDLSIAPTQVGPYPAPTGRRIEERPTASLERPAGGRLDTTEETGGRRPPSPLLAAAAVVVLLGGLAALTAWALAGAAEPRGDADGAPREQPVDAPRDPLATPSDEPTTGALDPGPASAPPAPTAPPAPPHEEPAPAHEEPAPDEGAAPATPPRADPSLAPTTAPTPRATSGPRRQPPSERGGTTRPARPPSTPPSPAPSPSGLWREYEP